MALNLKFGTFSKFSPDFLFLLLRFVRGFRLNFLQKLWLKVDCHESHGDTGALDGHNIEESHKLPELGAANVVELAGQQKWNSVLSSRGFKSG